MFFVQLEFQHPAVSLRQSRGAELWLSPYLRVLLRGHTGRAVERQLYYPAGGLEILSLSRILSDGQDTEVQASGGNGDFTKILTVY